MKVKLGVFFGGKSVEHEVSIITALQAIENIDKSKYDVLPIYIAKNNKMYVGDKVGQIESYKNIDELIAGSTQITLAQKGEQVCLIRCDKKIFENSVYDHIDVAFPIVHGTNVEDGTLQGFLKMFNLPYVGCDVTSSACGMDKYVCKCVLQAANIPVLESACFNSREYEDDAEAVISKIEKNSKYPVIVKPVNLGSSVGIKIAKNREALEEAIDNALGYAKKILVERAVTNLKEVNCSVIGDYDGAEASECEEPVKSDEILSFNDKYISGGGKKGGQKSMNAGCLKLPADITKKQREAIQKLAIETFMALGCCGVIRIDFIIDGDSGEIFVNEVNTIPGSLSFHLWRATGVEYKKHLNKMIDLALKRNREEKALSFSFDSNILAGFTNGGLKGSKKLMK